jgi:hypothetical protein
LKENVVLQLLEHLKGGRTTVFHSTSTLHKPVPGTAQEDNEVASVSE